MRLRRITPTIGICLALVVGSPVAFGEPTDEPGPTPTSEPPPASELEPEPEPSPTATATEAPSPTPTATEAPAPTTAPTSSPTTSPTPTKTSTPTSTPTATPTTAPTSSPTTSPTSTPTASPTDSPSAPQQPLPTYTPPPNPWSGSRTPVAVAPEPEPLAPAVLAAQIAQADRLLASLSAGNAELAALLDKLDELTDETNAALERKAEADEKADTATAMSQAAQGSAERLTEQLADKRQQLRDWAFAAYADGGTAAEMVSVLDALLTDADKAGNPVGDLTYLTDQRIRIFEDIRDLTERQQRAADRAEAQARIAQQAAEEAALAKTEAEEALQEQKDLIAATEEEQVAILQEAAPLAAMLLGMSSPEAKARGQDILDELMERNLDLPELVRQGQACSTDTGVYPNGQLPASALCELWMAPGHYARPQAAAAFQAMSQKFAADLGKPICVTSSYRSFADQVAVKARRGFWAATPGYSNHGIGKAIDLCGGINSFGTIEHLWMRQNAPMFGWFHPAWAAAGGNKPEPWHWEFAG